MSFTAFQRSIQMFLPTAILSLRLPPPAMSSSTSFRASSPRTRHVYSFLCKAPSCNLIKILQIRGGAQAMCTSRIEAKLSFESHISHEISVRRRIDGGGHGQAPGKFLICFQSQVQLKSQKHRSVFHRYGGKVCDS